MTKQIPLTKSLPWAHRLGIASGFTFIRVSTAWTAYSQPRIAASAWVCAMPFYASSFQNTVGFLATTMELANGLLLNPLFVFGALAIFYISDRII